MTDEHEEPKPTVEDLASVVEDQGAQLQQITNAIHGLQGSIDALQSGHTDAQGDDTGVKGISVRDVLDGAHSVLHGVLNPTVLKAGALIALIEIFSDGDPMGANDAQQGAGTIEELLQAILSLLG